MSAWEKTIPSTEVEERLAAGTAGDLAFALPELPNWTPATYGWPCLSGFGIAIKAIRDARSDRLAGMPASAAFWRARAAMLRRMELDRVTHSSL